MPLKRLGKNIKREASNLGSRIERPFRTGATQARKEQQAQLDLQREEIERQRRLEDERRQRIEQGTDLIDRRFAELGPQHPRRVFGTPRPEIRTTRPAIWDQHAQSYQDWANPQVSQQFRDANDRLMFRLDDMGHGAGSSTMVNRTGRLQDDYTQARADVADRSLDIANQTRQNINAQRAQMVNLLQQTGDPSQISSQLGQVVDTLRAAPSFSPVGPVFQNATAGLGSYLDGLRFGQMQTAAGQTPTYSNPSSGSGRVVR